MPIQLNRREKNYLVALYGDISLAARKRLFQEGSLPMQCGAEVLRDGYELVTLLRDHPDAANKARPRARRPFPYGSAGQPENRTQQARMKDTGHPSTTSTPPNPGKDV